jgi:ADP-ribosylglycohydrolase
MTTPERLVGCLIGTAVGDAIALPTEGLSRARIARHWRSPLRHRLLFGSGLVSDDTEHAFLTAQALVDSKGQTDAFRRALAWRLRGWFACLPPGVGLATAKACLRLWCGVSPEHSGVWSAGNGPAMRAPILGAFLAQDAIRRKALVTISTRLTHRDPKGLTAALAVAETAAWIVCEGDGNGLVKRWVACSDDPEWQEITTILSELLAMGADTDELTRRLKCEEGVSGYAYRSVPVALYAWLRHRNDARAGIEAIMRCGGDTDTVGAIAGSLYGLDRGEVAFPVDWIADIHDWPLSSAVLRRAGQALATDGARPVAWCWPLLPLRNVFVLTVVLAHGFRRLLP